MTQKLPMNRILAVFIYLLLLTSTFPAWAGHANQPPHDPFYQLTPGWNRVEPGGDTRCADGSPFAFWVHPGTNDRVTLHLNGGGACWNAVMCAFGGGPQWGEVQTYVNQVVDIFTVAQAGGMFALDDPENPFKDDTLIGVPYCTGDAFTGSRTVTYSTAAGMLEIHHIGYINMTAVLEWLYAHYLSPGAIVVTGCSMGSIGASIHAPRLMEHYPDVPVYQLNDSFVGITDGPPVAFAAWGAYDSLPNWIPKVATMRDQFDAATYIQAVANAYHLNRFAHFTHAFDEAQAIVYGLLQVPDERWTDPSPIRDTIAHVDDLQIAWSEAMFAAFERVTAPNFAAFIAPGDGHCVLASNSLYTVETNRVRLLDWITDFIGHQPLSDVVCSTCATTP